MLVLTLNEFGIPSKLHFPSTGEKQVNSEKLVFGADFSKTKIGFRKHAFKTKIADL